MAKRTVKRTVKRAPKRATSKGTTAKKGEEVIKNPEHKDPVPPQDRTPDSNIGSIMEGYIPKAHRSELEKLRQERENLENQYESFATSIKQANDKISEYVNDIKHFEIQCASLGLKINDLNIKIQNELIGKAE